MNSPASSAKQSLPEDGGTIEGSTAMSHESPPSPHAGVMPAGWNKWIHLNGSIYYTFHDDRVLTSENICDTQILHRINQVYHKIRHHLFTEMDWEITIAFVGNSERITFVSYPQAAGHEYDPITRAPQRLDQPSVWKHIQRFPMHRGPLPRHFEIDFISALAYGSNERVLDIKNTTFPYEDSQIERLIRVFRDLRDLGMHSALTHHVARVMVEIESTRKQYNYGTQDARVYRNIAIPAPTPTVWFYDLFLALLFCGTHKNYRVRLEATVPKGDVALSDFRQLMRNLLSEWADSNLVATVMVSVNVGFLAVPNISNLQRASSLVSSLCAMASIVSGLYHVWTHREKVETEQEDARQYLYYLNSSRARTRDPSTPVPLSALELTLTACLLAVPLATLQWSVLSFTLAIAAFAVQTAFPDGAGAGHASFIALLAVLGALALAVFLFFWRIWTAPPHREMEEGLDPNVAEGVKEPYADVARRKVKEMRQGVNTWIRRASRRRKTGGKESDSGA